MAPSPRHRISELLASDVSMFPSSAHETASADDLGIDVRGIGPISLPVSAARAKELRFVSRRAPYGLGEETLVDRSVRDAWQVPRSRIKIDKRRWNRTLNPMLGRFRQELGLPDTCRLEAQFHSMLVYEPGGFFRPPSGFREARRHGRIDGGDVAVGGHRRRAGGGPGP